MNVIGIIPARLKSTRLKEKLLIKVKGKTIIEYVYENAKRVKLLKKLYVATDSIKIKQIIENIGGKVILTSKKCKSGAERIKETLKIIRANINDIIVNIQGDEPLLEPSLISKVIETLINDKQYDVSTLATYIKNQKEYFDPNIVKVVIGMQNNALYFSRAPIPFFRDRNIKNKYILKHIGIYAYRKSVLDKLDRMKSKYENIEKLEQLRLLENSCSIKVIIGKTKSIGIDTKEDLEKFKSIMR